MTDLMKSVLALTVSGTALAAALALLRRILKEKLPKAVFYYLWLLVLLRLIVPVALPVPGLELAMESPKMEVTAPPTVENRPSDVVQTPVQVNPPATQTAPSVIITDGNGQTQAEPPQTPWYEGAWAFLCENFAPIWLTGAAMHFLWFAFSYFRFSHGLKQDCTPLLEHEQALLDNLRGDMPVAACRSGLAQTPMLLGLLRPRIVLPETAINTRELECILRHELTHLRRRDLLYKWFTVAVTSFHWFNPLMPWLRKEISRACELSCDEGVIGAMDDEHKRLYGETLLALAAANALPRAVPATTLCEEKKQLRERLLGIKKYHKTTLLMAVLSVLLALLVAGCAAVLGPQLKKETFTGPLTEEQQAPVLENIKAWAEESIQADGEITVTYSEPNDKPQSMGSLVEIATVHLYDLSSNTIRPVDGIYPDSEQLGHMTLMAKEGETVRDIHVFYLTNGDPAKGTSPVESLKAFAAAYPVAKANYLSWEQREGQPLYIKMFFIHEGKESIFEYSGVCGRWGVRERETASDKRAAIPADALPQMMDRIIQWQIDNGGDTDGRNFTLVNGMTLETPASHGILDQVLDDWQTVQVYNMATGDLYTLEGDYTGAVEYGCFTLLNVEDPESRIFLIDNDDKDPVTPEPEGSLAGQVAVLTKNAPLDNAFAQTVDTEGRTVVMDMAVALKKGDLVYVESQEGEICAVTVLAGEPPRVQGQLNTSILSVEQAYLENANQVILKDAKMWHGDPDEGVFSDSACTGVANVERRKTVTRDSWSPEGTVQTQEDWYCVTLPGGDNAFWARREDIVFTWPLPETVPDLSGKSFYYEGGGFSGIGEFTLKLHADGTFGYYEGPLSSHIGMGSWSVEGDTLILREDTFSRVFHFHIEDGGLSYIKKTSAPFTYVKLEDGARFFEDIQIPEAKTVSWLETTYQDHTVLAWERVGAKDVLLAGITNPGAQGYQMLGVYVINNGDKPEVLAKQLGEPNISAGISAHVMTESGLTVLFGDTDDSVYNYPYDKRTPVNFSEVQLIMADGQVETHAIAGNGPYLIVLEGIRQIADLAFVSGDAVVRYSDFYQEPVMDFAFEEQSILYQKTADWLSQEFHWVYDPYYDIQSLTISNWQESGSEATFYYKMSWLNYNRDPDTVDYVVEAKKQGQAAYEKLYNDYLALKEGSYRFKIVWEGDTPTLYTDVSVKEGPEWELTEVQNFVLR